MKRLYAKRTAVMVVALFTAIMTYSQESAIDYKMKIESLNKEMAKAMIEGNHEKNLSMYTSDAISMPANEPMKEGIAAIRAGVEEMAGKGFKIVSYEPAILKVIPEGNQITEIGKYKISFTVPGNESQIKDHGKYLTIWAKQPDGSLKIKVEMWNSDIQPMMEHE
jgi:ketosteroid isomerase-like protein